MPDTEIQTIIDRLDTTHIDTAAKAAFIGLKAVGAARVDLTPGDMTIYRIIILAPDFRYWADGKMTTSPRDGYLVTLAGGKGRTWTWHGDLFAHWSYVADKWTDDGNMWTGVVLAEFLNRLGAFLQAKEPVG